MTATQFIDALQQLRDRLTDQAGSPDYGLGVVETGQFQVRVMVYRRQASSPPKDGPVGDLNEGDSS